MAALVVIQRRHHEVARFRHAGCGRRLHERRGADRRRDQNKRLLLRTGLFLVRHDGHDDLIGGHWRAAVDMLDHAQFMWAGGQRRVLCNDDPFAVCIGLILGQLLVAIEQDDLGPGWARPAITPRPSGPIRAISKLGMATVGGGTDGGAAIFGVAASTGGDGAGAAGEVAAALAAWPRMAGSPGSPCQASPRIAAVTTAPAAISQMRRPNSVATSLCEWKLGSIRPSVEWGCGEGYIVAIIRSTPKELSSSAAFSRPVRACARTFEPSGAAKAARARLRGHRGHALCAQAAHLRLHGQGTLR